MAEKFPVKLQSVSFRQSLSLWERWHGASRDGEGEDACLRTNPLSLATARQLPRRGSFIRADRKMPKSSPFGGAGIERSEMTERVGSPLGELARSA